MARYTGPVCRICRREGEKLYLKGERCLTKCPLDRGRLRASKPGQHGAARGRKASGYATQLREKQKVRKTYGVLERQFKRHFDEAARRPGKTSDNLIYRLEMRMDNIVYRLGFGDSRAQARQLVAHGHFQLNGHKLDIPSAIVKPGDEITVRPRSRDTEYFKTRALTLAQKSIPAWLRVDANALSGRVLAAPTPQDLELPFNEQLVVEFYQR